MNRISERARSLLRGASIFRRGHAEYKEDMMPGCRKCGKRGLFLRIERDTGLCPSCHEAFAQGAKILTEKIMASKSEAAASKDPRKKTAACEALESYGNELVSLHQVYNLQPSQPLLDLIEVHRKIREES